MVNVRKHIDYWRTGAEEDIAAAGSLLEKGHPRHALFFAHLAVEKMLKAMVVKATDKEPPRIHNLVRLAEIAGVEMSDERLTIFGRLQRFCLEGRYPGSWPPTPSKGRAESGLREAQEVLKWIEALSK